MSGGRVGVFDEEIDLDLSEFRPKPAAPDQVRGIAEQAGFRSREPVSLSHAPSAAPAAAVERREPRRHRTGRNQQLNIKAKAEAIAAFYALADEQGWVLGETFERAVAALGREVSEGKLVSNR